MQRTIFLVLAAAALSACTSEPVSQYLISAQSPALRIRPLVSSLEVRDITLPRYVTADEIAARSPDGAVRALPGTAWADDPQRQMTLGLARNLGTITEARVAAEPWPFSDQPAAQVTVRIEQLLAGPDNILRLNGQYAIAPIDSDLRDRSGRLEIAVPLPGEGPGAIAAAMGAATTEMAETIARRLSR